MHLGRLCATLRHITLHTKFLTHGARIDRPTSATDTVAQQQTRRPPLLLLINRTDGRTSDIRRYVDPDPHIM